MEHPLLDLVPGPLPEPEQDELLRALGALQDLGWSRSGIERALENAREIAGKSLTAQRPLVIYCDDQSAPFVAVRLPVQVSAKHAVELSSKLRERLELRELDKPGLSITFWSTISTAKPTHNRHHERHG